MKSTVSGTTADAARAAALAARSDRWKALPLMILMLSTCLPLNYNLEPARPMPVAEVAELTQAAVSSSNSMSSVGFVVFLAAIYGISGWMILKKPKVAAALLVRQWPLLLLTLFSAASALWSYFPDKVIANLEHSLGITFLVIAAVTRYRHDPWLFMKHLGYVLGANMLLHVCAVMVMPSYAIDWQGRWHGMATTPNTLGALALTTIWANAAVLICLKSEKDRYRLHLISIGLAAAALIGANSVTSILTSLCVVALISLFNKFRTLGLGANFYVGTIVVVLVATPLLKILGTMVDFSGAFEMVGRDSKLTGRAGVWEDAIIAISQQPLWGWSFDDHARLISAMNMPYPSYHNGYLDLAVSGGAIALILFFLILIKWAMDFTQPSRIATQIAPYSVPFVVTFLIHNLSEASLISPRSQLWQIFMMIVLLSACRKPNALQGHGGAESAAARFARTPPILPISNLP